MSFSCAPPVVQATNPAASGGKSIRLRVRSYGSPLEEEATSPKTPASHPDMVSTPRHGHIDDVIRWQSPTPWHGGMHVHVPGSVVSPPAPWDRLMLESWGLEIGMEALSHTRKCHMPAVTRQQPAAPSVQDALCCALCAVCHTLVTPPVVCACAGGPGSPVPPQDPQPGLFCLGECTGVASYGSRCLLRLVSTLSQPWNGLHTALA